MYLYSKMWPAEKLIATLYWSSRQTIGALVQSDIDIFNSVFNNFIYGINRSTIQDFTHESSSTIKAAIVARDFKDQLFWIGFIESFTNVYNQLKNRSENLHPLL